MGVGKVRKSIINISKRGNVNKKGWLIIGGAFNFVLALFHVFFPWIFSWKTDLQRISNVNRSILWTFHAAIIFLLFTFAYLSVFRRDELVESRLGRSFLVIIGVVWLLRAVSEIGFFRIGVDGAIWRLAIFLGLSGLYFGLAFPKKKST